ncbi:MAG: hypothetical protein E5Y60_32280, partial [Mesorhizobium sp.]
MREDHHAKEERKLFSTHVSRRQRPGACQRDDFDGVEVGGERFMVEMFYGDDQSNPATGADAAERLIVQNEVDFLLGPYTSGSTIAVQPICQKYQVPMISGSAESPNVWLAKPEFNFGIIPSVDTTSGQSLGVLVALSNPKAKTIAVIGVNE